MFPTACIPCRVDVSIALPPARASIAQTQGRTETDSDLFSIGESIFFNLQKTKKSTSLPLFCRITSVGRENLLLLTFNIKCISSLFYKRWDDSRMITECQVITLSNTYLHMLVMSLCICMPPFNKEKNIPYELLYCNNILQHEAYFEGEFKTKSIYTHNKIKTMIAMQA